MPPSTFETTTVERFGRAAGTIDDPEPVGVIDGRTPQDARQGRVTL